MCNADDDAKWCDLLKLTHGQTQPFIVKDNYESELRA